MQMENVILKRVIYVGSSFTFQVLMYEIVKVQWTLYERFLYIQSFSINLSNLYEGCLLYLGIRGQKEISIIENHIIVFGNIPYEDLYCFTRVLTYLRSTDSSLIVVSSS